MSSTLRPASASKHAVIAPPGPEPTTTISAFNSAGGFEMTWPANSAGDDMGLVALAASASRL